MSTFEYSPNVHTAQLPFIRWQTIKHTPTTGSNETFDLVFGRRDESDAGTAAVAQPQESCYNGGARQGLRGQNSLENCAIVYPMGNGAAKAEQLVPNDLILPTQNGVTP